MDDAVRLSPESFRAIYEESFRLWSGLYLSAAENWKTPLPDSYISAHDAFSQHPSFPPGLRLNHTKFTNHSRQQLQIGVAASSPIPLSTAKTPERDSTYASWFARGDQNYLSVLVLAWAYVLSARWTELMPNHCTLRYTSSQANVDQLIVDVDIADASPDEARWWAAVLAPGQGWQATLALGQNTFWSPWSVQLESSPRFSLSGREVPTASPSPPYAATAPSFSEAIRFLDLFCIRHNVADQSHAALAAVLLFPSMRGSQALQLPAPVVRYGEESTQVTLSPASNPHTASDCGPRDGWRHPESHLDRLITVSCHTKGIRPMLLSVFYEPSIECNSATPWLQGAIAAIDSLGQDDPLVLGRMFMDRLPGVAFLWLGATVLGLQKKLLRDVRFGLIPIDLHAAAWSGTVQSFIQQPVSDPLVADGYVTRADQCRLLFLCHSGSHDRVPVCQWAPFGATHLAHTDLEIRAHAECRGHGLQYQGLLWDCDDDKVAAQPARSVDVSSRLDGPLRPQVEIGGKQVPIFYGELNRKKEFVSENATRNIFGWLRIEGYAPDERKIREHEWFEMLESDEDEDPDINKSNKTPKSSARRQSLLLHPV
ncbi:hypothetical protein C8A01DRAFT_47258 [Parachaetomium inaequale]|uniref:Uncharacterized protein n=1 Tax=Parachaetomium inaequale TaxID=2588326 RepID=A0AAN6PDZ5_9PEZI|nr:hypothetical protein C8A01DRAFT_47258 [Parachaetomium inaequale]